MRLWIFLLPLLFGGQALASDGTLDGGGLPSGPEVPNVEFRYDCDLKLAEQGGAWRVSKGKKQIGREEIEKSGGHIEVPASIWIHGRRNPRNPPDAFELTNEVPPYNLEHFLGFSFFQEGATWFVSLRANVLFTPRVSGAAAFATAGFESPRIAARVIATGKNPDGSEQSLDFSVSCRKF
jgi:hypothetical protein